MQKLSKIYSANKWKLLLHIKPVPQQEMDNFNNLFVVDPVEKK